MTLGDLNKFINNNAAKPSDEWDKQEAEAEEIRKQLEEGELLTDADGKYFKPGPEFLYDNEGKIIKRPRPDYKIERKFAAYRHACAQKTKPACGFTYEDVYDTITQEELDYWLKEALLLIPELRYQNEKKAWHSHESCYYIRNHGQGGYDGYGCNDGKCIPECRFSQETGRITDEEIIEEHQKYVEKLRQENKIIKAPF